MGKSKKNIIQVFQGCPSKKEEIYFPFVIPKEIYIKKVHIFAIASSVNIVVTCFIIILII